MNKHIKMLITVLAVLVVVGALAAIGEDASKHDHFEKSLMQLKKALNKHNFGLVEDYFHEEFSYGDFGCGGGCSSASSIAGMIVSSYPHEVKDHGFK